MKKRTSTKGNCKRKGSFVTTLFWPANRGNLISLVQLNLHWHRGLCQHSSARKVSRLRELKPDKDRAAQTQHLASLGDGFKQSHGVSMLPCEDVHQSQDFLPNPYLEVFRPGAGQAYGFGIFVVSTHVFESGPCPSSTEASLGL